MTETFTPAIRPTKDMHWRPCLRFTISDRMMLKGTAGSPETYYFELLTPDVTIDLNLPE